MVNEAILKLKIEEPWDWIVADGTAIEKGTIMKMSGVGTAAPSDADGDKFACIARREKIVETGRTRLSGFRRGIFDMKVGDVDVVAGDWVAISGNIIRPATSAEFISGAAIGIAREDITAEGTGEIILGGF